MLLVGFYTSTTTVMFGVAGTRGRRRDNNIASNVLVTVVNIVQ